MLDQNTIERFMGKAINDKSTNTFLGFIEGVVLDGSINEKEIDALITWSKNIDVKSNAQFEMLFKVMGEITTKDGISEEFKQRFISVISTLKSTDFYVNHTADIQRLHGILGGLICDGTLTLEELEHLNKWLKHNDHLEEDVLYQDVFEVLRPLRTKKTMSQLEISKVFNQIKKYVDVDNHGSLRTTIDSNDNPDFYKGELILEDATYCFTGSSNRFSKKEWKALVENNNAKFVDDMTLSVNYLVICNKGNKAWAHVSYGRKFEQAKKWQAQGNGIKIITEDDFIVSIGLTE